MASVALNQDTYTPTLEAEIIRVLAHTDPDGVPTANTRTAWRDLSCKGSGPETYRKVRYPGQSDIRWPSGDRLPRMGQLAGDRRCTVCEDMPEGTIIIEFSRRISHFRKGKCDCTVGVMTIRSDGKPCVTFFDTKSLKARPVHRCELPGGLIIDVPRERD